MFANKKYLTKEIAEIEHLIKQLAQTWDIKLFSNLHYKIQEFSDYAFTYHYRELIESTGALQMFIDSLIDNTKLSETQMCHIELLLYKLKSTVPLAVKEYEEKRAKKEPICIIESERDWAKQIASQLNIFGFHMKTFDDTQLFVAYANHHLCTCIIVNIDMLDEHLEKILIEFKKKNVAIIFLAKSGEFELRQRAVSYGGKAFFIKPFHPQEITDVIYQLLHEDPDYLRVLVVDHLGKNQGYSIILQQAGMLTYELNLFEKINETLREFRPDFILINFNAEHAQDIDLIKVIRQQPSFGSTPIVFIAREEDRENYLSEMMHSGADDCLENLIHPEHLVLLVKNKVNRYRSLLSAILKDELTQTFNYTAIQQRLDNEFKLANRLGSFFSIAIIELADAKKIISKYGFSACDQVIKNLTFMLMQRLRTTDAIGRHRENQFLIILPHANLESAIKVMNNLREQFSKLSHYWNNQYFTMTFVAGIASFPRYRTASQLIQAAEAALQESTKNTESKI